MFRINSQTGRKLNGLFLAAIAMMSIVFGTTVNAQTPCPAGMTISFIDPTTGDAVFIKDQFPAPNDNSYGVNAVGWGSHGHTFGNLTGSDRAGFQVAHNGTAVLSFNIDYLTAASHGNTPSGYASLGPFGGDGGIVTGTLTANDLTWDTSLARNLNNLGYFSGGVQTVPGDAHLLTDSPQTVDHVSNYTLLHPAVWPGSYQNPETLRPGYPGGYFTTVTGWNFHNTYFAVINSAKMQALGAIENVGGQWRLKAGWTIVDNGVLHNSPAKTCPPPTTPTPTPPMTPTPTPPTTPTPTPPMTTPTPTPPSVPEPISIILFGTGLASLGFAARKRLGRKGQDASENDSQ